MDVRRLRKLLETMREFGVLVYKFNIDGQEHLLQLDARHRPETPVKTGIAPHLVKPKVSVEEMREAGYLPGSVKEAKLEAQRAANARRPG